MASDQWLVIRECPFAVFDGPLFTNHWSLATCQTRNEPPRVYPFFANGIECSFAGSNA